MAKKTTTKPKAKQILPAILIGLVAILVVFSLILTARKTSTAESTSPNAPASVPQASEGCMDKRGNSKCKAGKETCRNNVCVKADQTNSPTPPADRGGNTGGGGCTTVGQKCVTSRNDYGTVQSDCSCKPNPEPTQTKVNQPGGIGSPRMNAW